MLTGFSTIELSYNKGRLLKWSKSLWIGVEVNYYSVNADAPIIVVLLKSMTPYSFSISLSLLIVYNISSKYEYLT